MASSFWKAVGSKLLDIGVGYFEQSRLVGELRRLDGVSAADRFRDYVAGLGPAARAGFGITLQMLLRNETTPEGRRFVQSLIEALARSSAPPAVAAQPPRLAAPPADPESVLMAEADRVDAWIALGSDRGTEAAAEYLDAMSPEQLDHYRGQMEELVRRMDRSIELHKRNEARIAAGRYIEDQNIYRLGRIAGQPPDAQWLQTLRNSEHSRHFTATLATVAGETAARKRLTPPPPAAASPPPPAPPQELAELQALTEELTQELAAGTVEPDREPMLRRLLDKLSELVAASESGTLSAPMALARTQALMRDFLPYLASPGRAAAQSSPEGRVLVQAAGHLKALVAHHLMNFPKGQTADVLSAVLGDLMKVQEQAPALREAAPLRALESSLLRPAARTLHEALLASHALLARPLWACPGQPPRTNSLFVSGDDEELLTLVRSEAGRRQLEVEAARPMQDHGQMRWNALRACHVAVFDLRGAGPMPAPSALPARRLRALGASAYELGLAFALGKPVVVLAAEDDEMPFDIDLAPVRLQGPKVLDEPANGQALGRALDDAFYVPQRSADAATPAVSVAELRALVRDHPQRQGLERLGLLSDRLQADSCGFADAAGQVLGRLGGSPRWQLLRPAWPAAYPDRDEAPRCFHVMPFGAPWSDTVRDAARSACVQAGHTYRRGDEAEEGRVIHAIWDDLLRADTVLVDVTGINLNVLIELGMAHAVGRPVLLAQQSGSQDLRPPHIERLRVLRYGQPAQLGGWLCEQLRRHPRAAGR